MANENSAATPPNPADTDATPIYVTVPAAEFDEIKKDAEEYKDKYLRLLAEADNIRKRLQKERQELVQYSVQNVITDILNPIDHFENALKFAQQSSDEVKHWAQGFEMILSQFKDVLANNNVASFESEGMPFDPHRHEAIEMVVTSEYAPGIVINESLRGYKMGERIIRPARVKVTKAPDDKQKTETKKH